MRQISIRMSSNGGILILSSDVLFCDMLSYDMLSYSMSSCDCHSRACCSTIGHPTVYLCYPTILSSSGIINAATM